MTGRLAEVQARIDTVHKLSGVIAAMRGIAGARAEEARRHKDSISLFAGTIGAAIGRALALMPDSNGAPLTGGEAGGGGARRLVILLAAEQGFAGSYSEQVFGAADWLLGVADEVFVCGDRGLLVAAERGITPTGTAPMITHPSQAAALASRLTRMLYEGLTGAGINEVYVAHAKPVTGVQIAHVTRRLVPFDYGRFEVEAEGAPPLLTLPAATLLERLVEEYIFAELVEAIILSLAAENEARMRAMIAAHENVSASLADLIATSRRLRQDQITEEIVELAAGSRSAG